MRIRLWILPFLRIFLCTKANSCPDGSQPVPGLNDCIVAVQKPAFYKSVIRQCSAFGGNPVKIQNIFENAFVYSLGYDFPQSPYIGVEKNEDNVWTFADGSQLTYQNWAPGEPNTTNEANLCAVMDLETQKWMTSGCYLARSYFCSFYQSNGNDTINATTTTMTTTTITAMTLTSSSARCPNGWTYYAMTNFCYFFQNFTSSDRKDWIYYNAEQAESFCQDMGAHLASIHSKREDDIISDMILTYTNNCVDEWTWIGYSGNGTVGTGNWTDGTPVDYFGYAPQKENAYWLMVNDPLCDEIRWVYQRNYDTACRLVCKKPPKK